ncbi:MAG: M67 family metallopeptidase [Bacteroidota bacterium]
MISVSEQVLSQMHRHGERSYPEECCGALLGTDYDGVRLVSTVLEIDNSQGENRQRRFLITPSQYREAEQVADSRNLLLLGFYHSHPDHPAIPSQFDTDHAMPWLSYIIVSIARGKAEKTTAWLLRGDRRQFDESPIQVTSSEQVESPENLSSTISE